MGREVTPEEIVTLVRYRIITREEARAYLKLHGFPVETDEEN